MQVRSAKYPSHCPFSSKFSGDAGAPSTGTVLPCESRSLLVEVGSWRLKVGSRGMRVTVRKSGTAAFKQLEIHLSRHLLPRHTGTHRQKPQTGQAVNISFHMIGVEHFLPHKLITAANTSTAVPHDGRGQQPAPPRYGEVHKGRKACFCYRAE